MAGNSDRLWTLFDQLRRRRFPLGPDDYRDLWRALDAGFGWGSPRALRTLCCTLWAKSSRDREVVTALFDQLEWPDWRLPRAAAPRHEPGDLPAADELPATG